MMSRNPSAAPSAHTNGLAGQTSPYLLAHAHNPVDWQPWGPQALERAQREDKPIFLSIGYAACHWCHVMERETFENETIAQFLNEHFISIKVDREERPDLDALYMQAVTMLSSSGGWPMTVFLTPQGLPFYGGTYFPPEDRWGRLGFMNLIRQLETIWREQRGKAERSARQLFDLIRGEQQSQATEQPQPVQDLPLEVPHKALLTALGHLRRAYDLSHGGFGHAPKFPPSFALPLLLQEARTGREDAQDLQGMARHTLRRMACGGIYDQLGGGFHRYSTDERWLVPHFEKMLYDNALLAPIYLDAAQVLEEPFFKTIAIEILDYVLREMTSPQGGFYSTQDADSEGVEGKYFTWRPGEVINALGAQEGALFCEYYGVVPGGNWAEAWEGGSVLHVAAQPEEFARTHNLSSLDLIHRLEGLRQRLLAVRGQRVAPALDDKVITAWNGMMIRALARGAQATGQSRYAQAAARAARFILENLRGPKGQLLRTWRQGQANAINAFAEDYAHMIDALVELYQTDFDPAWLTQAQDLADRLLDGFYDMAGGGGFFTTDGSDATVIVRGKEFYDGATASGNSQAVHALLRLGRLCGRADYLEAAATTLCQAEEKMQESSTAYLHMLGGLAQLSHAGREVAIIGPWDDPRTQALLSTARTHHTPGQLIAWSAAACQPGHPAALLQNRPAAAQPQAWVCAHQTCHPPVQTPEQLRTLLL